MTLQVVSQGRRVPMFHDPFLSSTKHAWAGFMLEESDTKLTPLARAYLPNTTLFVCTAGAGVTHWKDRGVYNHSRIAPGMLSIGRGNCEVQDSWATNAWSRVVVQLDAARLRFFAPHDLDAIEASLPPVQTNRDGDVTRLVLAMRDEVREGCPSGRLFAESISVALLAGLARRYATPGEVTRTLSLSPAHRRSLVEYIQGNLANDISVTELAASVGMSPAYFSRLFRASFGVSPYRFVMGQRVEEAKRMLLASRLSATQIAFALGFASQSHFVKVFRRFAGVTPRQYREQR